MKQTPCGHGHIYDADVYPTCPYCNNNTSNTIDFSGDGGQQPIGKTVPVGGYTTVAPSTPLAGSTNETIRPTTAPSGYTAKQDQLKKTVGIFAKTNNLDPVVGWLVCVKGNDKGKDYRILAKTNTIGRGEAMDICISGDDTISSDKHAKLDYDVKNNRFMLIPAENRNTIYVNDEPVYSPTKLNPYDAIQFGESEVMFVPFCCDKFTWKDEKKGEE